MEALLQDIEEKAFDKGINENRKDIIKNSLEGGIPIQTMSIVLKLSVEEIKKIIKENNL